MSDLDDLREGDDPSALYANYFRIGYNAFEFFLDFGQRQPGSKQETFHTRIVTSPEHLDAFLDTLLRAASQYKAAMGGETKSQIAMETKPESKIALP